MNKYTPDEDALSIPCRVWLPAERTTRLIDMNAIPIEALTIDVIAHALAGINRYNNHTPWPYSVAVHSVLVSMLLPRPLWLEGTLHDGAETYTGDLINPIKRIPAMRAVFKPIETTVDTQIRRFYGLPWTETPAVKDADTKALYLEQYILQGKPFSKEALEVLTNQDYLVAESLCARPIAWNDARDMFRIHWENITKAEAS